MNATIKDVAKVAGVSFKTVSRVINNESTVSEALQVKVRQAIQELNYKPNLSARGLRGSTSSIGFLYDNPNSNYVIDMQKGIFKECQASGYELLIHPCESDHVSLEDEIIEMISRSTVGGLILTPPVSDNIALVKKLAKKQIKFVRIVSGSAPPDEFGPFVLIDDRQAAYEISTHLIELGHKDLVFMCGDAQHKSNTERLNGFLQALANRGLNVKDENILSGNFSFDSGVLRTNQLLARGSALPSAIFACNDEIAAGCLFAARAAGIDVPTTLSIAGFEDSPYSRQTWPYLTTAKQHNVDIAKIATKMLIKEIKSPTQKPQDNQVFCPELLVRDSTTEF
ncbi:LacI family DNA-binding transcriptional regulator [Alteromonas sp. C1M14]|uniref:LacI family DNA-binding transcriptional regulator n=1 Tax=Alteromonas sp. C1M14 TaxID=2841567 RepID=UPI001C09EAA9|nr:LacI family DNA-binding transcriptional regulator [Alteromonas sp. C1M14]MBU2979567.1 LacI family DNA-binding transcriptional regulator [Alteromonas sp. C1M14]